MESTRRKPRADALRNRDQLIEAAKKILGQGGPGASLEAVAREAGVGIGTLYRHFPTREALFETVYRHEVDQLVDLASRLETRNDGLEALRIWLHAMVGLMETKRGLLGTLAIVATENSKAMYAEVSSRLKDAINRLIARAKENGEMRPDVSAEIVLSTVYAVGYARAPGPEWKSHVQQVIDIFVDGMRVH